MSTDAPEHEEYPEHESGQQDPDATEASDPATEDDAEKREK